MEDIKKESAFQSKKNVSVTYVKALKKEENICHLQKVHVCKTSTQN